MKFLVDESAGGFSSEATGIHSSQGGVYCELSEMDDQRGAIMKTSTISKKGWVVIPQELRARYGLKKGDRVRIIDYGGIISIIPTSETPIKDAKGMLQGETSLVGALTESRREDTRHSRCSP